MSGVCMMSWRDISVTPPACLGVNVTGSVVMPVSLTAPFSATQPTDVALACFGMLTLPLRPDSTRTPRRRASKALRSGPMNWSPR